MMPLQPYAPNQHIHPTPINMPPQLPLQPLPLNGQFMGMVPGFIQQFVQHQPFMPRIVNQPNQSQNQHLVHQGVPQAAPIPTARGATTGSETTRPSGSAVPNTPALNSDATSSLPAGVQEGVGRQTTLGQTSTEHTFTQPETEATQTRHTVEESSGAAALTNGAAHTLPSWSFTSLSADNTAASNNLAQPDSQPSASSLDPAAAVDDNNSNIASPPHAHGDEMDRELQAGTKPRQATVEDLVEDPD
jgi:hypothetical protein